MKQTSIDKLSEVYNYLLDRQDAEDKIYVTMIREILRAETITPSKAGKFDIYNYVAKDDIQPQMCGVYHDSGFKVASDGHILVAVKEEYGPDLEQTNLRKDGSFYEQKRIIKQEDGTFKSEMTNKPYVDERGHNHPVFPRWREVVPESEGATACKVDKKKFYDWVDKLRAMCKAETGKGKKWDTSWVVKVGVCAFKAELFAKMIEAMDYLGTDEILEHGSKHVVKAESDKGMAILMPIMVSDEFGTSEDRPGELVL